MYPGKWVLTSAAILSAITVVRAADTSEKYQQTKPLPESAEASITEGLSLAPPTRPDVPEPSTPEAETKAPEDNKWEHLTGDWRGYRGQLEERGIFIASDLTIDFSKNLQGGADTRGSALRHLFNFNITLDSEKLLKYKGGTFFANFQTKNGQSGSDEAGDYQGLSNIDADGRTQLSEIWYEQKLLEDKLRLKIGKIDANSEFAATDYSGEFINSSFGFSPTILGMITYPDPSFGFIAFINPCDSLYIGGGVFDGAGQEGYTTGDNGFETVFGDPADLFLIGEAGVRWKLKSDILPGRLAAGVWHHTGTFDEFDGGTSNGATGPYLIVDQMLWKESPDNADDEQGIALSLQYGYADPSYAELEHHFGAACCWQGLVPGRDDDALGLGATWVRFSDDAGFDHNDELTIEMFYKFKVTEFAVVKPDLQYIHNPSGTFDDALSATVRVSIDF